MQEEARKRRAPVLEDADEFAARDVFGRVLFQRESQSHAVQRGPERELDVIDDEGPGNRYGDGPAALFELPSIGGAGARPCGTGCSGAPSGPAASSASDVNRSATGDGSWQRAAVKFPDFRRGRWQAAGA
jgi:hypothetical protein